LETVSVYLGLGSNLGDRKDNLDQAISMLSEKVHIEKTSSIYETEPVGHLDQGLFLNAVCYAKTILGPDEMLSFIKRIESKIGRISTFRNAPRPIDIDILFYGEEIIDTPTLNVPHLLLTERLFVLVPLIEIAPDIVHPVSNLKVADILSGMEIHGLWAWNGENNDV